MDHLVYESFIQDKRCIEAKKVLIETLKEYQSTIQSVRSPDPKRTVSYKKALEQLLGDRGHAPYFPYIGSGMGNGALVELMDGSVKYDLISGIGPHFFGHGFSGLTEKMLDAALCDIIMQGNLQQNVISISVLNKLIKASKMDHGFLSSSGTMAGENALKISFQKNTPRTRILAFDNCFSGRSLALLNITDKHEYREGLPSVLSVDYVPFFNYKAPEKSIETTVFALKKLLKRYPKQHAVMCFELVQGEGGIYPGTRSFFTAIMKLLKDEGIIIWVDEVQTFARTGALFCSHYFQLEEYVDIITIGKIAQICATLYKKSLLPKKGLLSQTWTGSSTALYAAEYILEYLLQPGIYGPDGKITKIHALFVEELLRIKKKYPEAIHPPFGIGAMAAFTPFTGDRHVAGEFVQRLFENGIITFTAGKEPTRVRFLLPSIVLQENDIKEIGSLIERTIKECL